MLYQHPGVLFVCACVCLCACRRLSLSVQGHRCVLSGDISVRRYMTHSVEVFSHRAGPAADLPSKNKAGYSAVAAVHFLT